MKAATMHSYDAAIKNTPQQPQQQCGTADQAMALMVIIDRLGLHGALDYLRTREAAKYSMRSLDGVVDPQAVEALGNLPVVDGLSLEQELAQARRAAIRFGLYDAADLVRIYIETVQPTASSPRMG